jgi:hypothetical protein
VLFSRRKKVLKSLTTWPHPAESERSRRWVVREGYFGRFHWPSHVSVLVNGNNWMDDGRNGLEGKTKFNLDIQVYSNFPGVWRLDLTFVMVYR